MAVQVFIGGNEVTSVVLGGSSTHRLNKVWDATFRIPIDRAISGVGLRGKIVIDGEIEIHGFITSESAEDATDGDGTVEYRIEDPREMWQWRPARMGPFTSDPGNYITPKWFEEIGIYGMPVILNDIFLQSIDTTDPATGDGPLFIELGEFQGGGVDVTDPGPLNYPQTIEDIVALFVSTGECDVILTPIDYGGYMAHLDVWNGNYGTDRSGTVKFQYATGSHNADRMRRIRDLATVANKLRYLLGPPVDGPNRYKRSIELTNTDFPFDIMNLTLCDIGSRISYGVRSEIQIYDINNVPVGNTTPLYQYLWFDEAVFRCMPRDLVHVTPIAGILPTFDIGDIITVEAGTVFMGGFSAKQRVYERTVSWDTEGVISLGEIVSSEAGA